MPPLLDRRFQPLSPEATIEALHGYLGRRPEVRQLAMDNNLRRLAIIQRKDPTFDLLVESLATHLARNPGIVAWALAEPFAVQLDMNNKARLMIGSPQPCPLLGR